MTEPEPLPRDHPLLALDNIIIAPHWGTATETAVRGMTKAAIDNILQGRFSELASLIKDLNYCVEDAENHFSTSRGRNDS